MSTNDTTQTTETDAPRGIVPLFGLYAPLLLQGGYSPVPIDPGDKRPLGAIGDWSRLRTTPLTDDEIAAIATAHPNAGLGVAGGYGGLVPVDIDTETTAILTAAEPVVGDAIVAKRGRRGATIFGRDRSGLIKARKFKTVGGVMLVEVLTTGQTVIPPTIHPETGEPYRWLTEYSLFDVPIEELPEFPPDLIEQLEEVLKPWLPPSRSYKRKANGDARPASPKRMRAYAETALVGEAQALRAAPKGGRNRQLFDAACKLGRYVYNEVLSLEEVEAALLEACNDNGLVKDDGLRACGTTLASGLRKAEGDELPNLEDRKAPRGEARSSGGDESAGDDSAPRSDDPGDDPPHWNVEPWPEPVSGAELLDDICAVLRRYMIVPRYAVEAIALWIMHAWTIDASEISPILIIVSPTKQCGKSTLMTVIYWVTPRSELISNATASPIFRLIEDAKPKVPTFLLDEGDTFITPEKEDLRGILNSGWMRAGARVIRTEGDGNKRRAKRFSTWAPKVIATIKAVADTLMDRGVIIMLRRKARGETVERFRMRDTDEFGQLRQRCQRWANDNLKGLRDADPDIPEALTNRPADNWRPLLAIADAVGGDWPARARQAALGLTGARDDDDKGVMLLRDIRRVFEEARTEWMGAEALTEKLVTLPETPWAEWRRGEKPISSRGVAFLLKPFEIESDDSQRPRRYLRRDFEQAWDSYLFGQGGDSSGSSG